MKKLSLFRNVTVSLALVLGFALILTGLGGGLALAADAGSITLPPPEKTGGKPLMQCLNERKSTRSFSDAPLPTQELSNLLWATWGVNRPDGRRTAPMAKNEQNVAVYVVLADGVWRYEGKSHELIKELGVDARSRFGGAPVTLVYAAEEGPFAGLHVGSLYQNAGLYCASAGLASVVKATGASALDGELKLPAGYKVLIVQPVGFPR
jgi:hypothetical protein